MPGPASSRLVDRAADLNLDFHQGAVLAWGDHDADGWADAYLLGEHAVDVALRRGAGFEILPGTDVGLTLPETHQPAVTQFDFAALQLAELEAGGALDLWLLSAGRDRSHRLFRREADGFVDVSDASGVTGVSGGIFAVFCDFDNDGDVDGLSDGRRAGEDPDGLPAGAGHAVLWHNHGGGRFDLERLPASVVPRPVHAATCLDADGDGVTDVAAVGPERYLLPNATAPAGGWIDVAPTDRGRPALGAEVRLTYSDGRVVVQRLGSARNSAFSQTVAALRFGVPRTARVVELSVRWPGEATPRRHPPPATGTVRVIERRTDPVQPPT